MSKKHFTKYYSNKDYYFSKQDLRILIKATNQWIKVNQEVFTALEHSCWNSCYSDNQYSYHTTSLDNPISENDESALTYSDILSTPFTEPENITIENFRNALLFSAYNELSDVQQQIIYGQFFDDLTEKDLAKMLGVSQPAIHYQKRKALQFMREYLDNAEYER